MFVKLLTPVFIYCIIQTDWGTIPTHEKSTLGEIHDSQNYRACKMAASYHEYPLVIGIF